MEAPGSGPAPPGVQVTRERVLAPPDRFLSLSDDVLLESFQGLLGCEGERGAHLAALYSLLEGVCQHEFLNQRRRLEADFALFSGRGGAHVGAASAGKPKGMAPRLRRLSSIEAHERRFLLDFMQAMHSSHYRLLGQAEWEAAQAEAFLFTLPVSVDWSALDKRMLQRFWGDASEQRQQLPDLSDRILIFCRGFEPARMRGRYLMQKVELLLSFCLLAPLWAALERALQLLGLKAPPTPPTARPAPHQHPDISFKSVGTAAQVACRWRRAAQGGLERDESLMHDACTIIERKTMSRHFPNGRAVLSRFFDVVELQEACFRDVVVLFRRKVAKEAGGEGEKEVLHQEADPAVAARNIHIKQFTGIPLADLEMVMPEKKVFVPPSVFVQLVVAAVVALVGLLATFLQAQLDWKVWASALGLLASRASSAYLQAASERSEIEREMHRLLANRTVASQEAVLHTLTDEMCRQHIRECFLCYCCLLHAGKDLRDDDLDTRCERLLRSRFALRLDFTAENAIPALCGWGLVERQPCGRLRAAALPQALLRLDRVWDSIFDFARPGAAGGTVGGTASGSGDPRQGEGQGQRTPGMEEAGGSTIACGGASDRDGSRPASAEEPLRCISAGHDSIGACVAQGQAQAVPLGCAEETCFAAEVLTPGATATAADIQPPATAGGAAGDAELGLPPGSNGAALLAGPTEVEGGALPAPAAQGEAEACGEGTDGPPSLSAESSSSSLEYVTLRGPPPAAAARPDFKRSPSARLSPAHLRRLDSLRRQRAGQEAGVARGCPPASPPLAAMDGQLAGRQQGGELGQQGQEDRIAVQRSLGSSRACDVRAGSTKRAVAAGVGRPGSAGVRRPSSRC